MVESRHPSQPSAGTPDKQITSALLSLYRDLTGEADVYTALTKLARHLRRALEADLVWVVTVDEENQPVFGVLQRDGTTSPRAIHRLREEAPPALGEVLHNKEPVWVTDATEEAGYGQSPLCEGMRSLLWIPLKREEEQTLGAVLLGWKEPHVFRPSAVALAHALSTAAAQAISAALTQGHAHYWVKVIESLTRVIETLSQEMGADKIVQQILQHIVETLRVGGVLFFHYEPAKESLRVEAAAGADVSPEAIGKELDVQLTRLFIEQGRPVLVPDTSSTAPFLEGIQPFSRRPVQAFYGVPVRVMDKPLGALIVLNPPQEGFDPAALVMLSGLASLAGAGLWRAHLFAALQQAHEQYRELFNDTLDWIFITDLQGRVVEANRSAKEALDFTWEALRAGTISIDEIHMVDTAVVPQDLAQVPARPPLRYESRIRTPRGEEVIVTVYVHRVMLGEKPHLQWIFRDITEAKRLETLREDLLAMVYHDLRSPLGNIVSGVDMLTTLLEGQTLDNRDSVFMTLDIIRRASERLQRLTSTLLDIRRLESGQPVVHPRPVQPQQLLLSVLELAQPMAEAKDQLLILAPVEDLPPVLADVDMIHRALMNLVENAIKYTPPGGRIELGASREGDMVRFWVRDTGPGIPVEEQASLFEKYSRGSTSVGVKGLGLGLAYCRLAVEAHQGRIGVDSEPGKGSTFFFTLPKAVIDGARTATD